MNYHESWNSLFELHQFNLNDLYSGPDIVYPKKEDVFKVFEMDVKDIKILLLGQDPYHGPDQAHGLSFSVPENVPIPKSLKNIYKELNNEFPERDYTFNSGNLDKWFYKERIFLLNSSLSVIKGKPGSHIHLWEKFTNDVIKFVSNYNNNCVFLLLGAFAKDKSRFIQNKDRIVIGVHPSPLSAYKGFFNSDIFIKVETILGEKVDWSV
jgi:uracil-DNA glycosylase